MSLSAETGILHLVRSLLLSQDWSQSLFMALTAHFDASGHEADQKHIAVAGFVSSGADWVDFDRLWNERLKQDKIDYFHANEFYGCHQQFKDWKGDTQRQEAFRSDLMDILKRHVYRKFACVVVNQGLREEMSEDIKRQNYICGYSLAGRVCVARLWEWMLFDRWRNPPEIIFERGDIGMGVLRDGLIQDEFPEPIFKPKRDRIRKDGLVELGITPLQTADWLAYECFLTAKTLSADRWAMREFASTPGQLEILQAHDLKEMQEFFESTNILLKARLNELRLES